MGSSGSGSLSDYSDQNPTTPNGTNGGASKIDKCNLAFATSLEEVSRCDYYKKKGIPPIGTEVTIIFNKIRLTAVDSAEGHEIGYLPTKFNYIKNCMDDGFAYKGIVRTNAVSPTPNVLVDITPY